MLDIIINPFVNILLYIYDFLGHSVNDFGWAIIIFTVMVRLALYPLTKSQIDSSKKLQELNESEKYKKMQQKYKDNKEKLAEEQMKLYQEMGINPLGSCLPTLLQFPIIIGLYWAVTKALATSPVQLLSLLPSISLENASALLPLNSHFLWMDLSQPERWYGLTRLLGYENIGIPVMAILVFISSYFQTKLMTPPSSNPNDQAAGMSKMMSIYMPVLMAWLSYSYSAGLALYFVASNLVSLLQYGLMGRLNLSNLTGRGKEAKAK
ncbi:MAG TPA: YidC/Oxa1 family membrane protein insertase [Anaerolineales bacterium]|nr:YidC/Oxa1 family membrane protein insertase [Anaerolineales bacterium]